MAVRPSRYYDRHLQDALAAYVVGAGVAPVPLALLRQWLADGMAEAASRARPCRYVCTHGFPH